MRRTVLVVTSFVTLAVPSAPALAITPASFDITGGSLSISAPSGSNVSLGSQLASGNASILAGPLGTVTVSDLRGGSTSWTASVISSAFTPTAGPAVPAASVSYSSGTISTSGPVTPVGGTFANLTGVVGVVTATSTGPSTATWNPTISIAIPANLQPGTYTATITHSVA